MHVLYCGLSVYIFCVLLSMLSKFSLFHFQELQSELDALKLASQSTQQNGPVGKEETDTAGSPAMEDQVQIHVLYNTCAC